MLEHLLNDDWMPQHLLVENPEWGELESATVAEAMALSTAEKWTTCLALIEIARLYGIDKISLSAIRHKAMDNIVNPQNILLNDSNSSNFQPSLVNSFAPEFSSNNTDLCQKDHHLNQGHPSNKQSPLKVESEDQRLNAAIRLREEGNPEMSLKMIEEELKSDNPNPWWLDNKARAYSELGRHIDALNIWQLLIRYPDVELAHTAKSMEYIVQSMLVKTLTDICLKYGWKAQSISISLDGEKTVTESIYEEISTLIHQKKSDLVIELSSYAMSIGIESAWLQNSRARALYEIERKSEAIDQWLELKISESMNYLHESDLSYASMRVELENLQDEIEPMRIENKQLHERLKEMNQLKEAIEHQLHEIKELLVDTNGTSLLFPSLDINS